MFFEEIFQRNHARKAFQKIVNQKFDKHIHVNRLDSLFETIDILSIDHDLQKTSIVTMFEPLYDSKLSFQTFERVHRFDQKKIVTVYIFHASIDIEKSIDEKRKSKKEFTTTFFAFIKTFEMIASKSIQMN